ncbi:MAG: hypothetical protein NC299_18205 [Lachnospiraceae bacterium]|nr:hypothetical protein [Ruminococcus sp.]MCM1277262.1 hypothetical protein [Lachnospiraceae bacterium]
MSNQFISAVDPWKLKEQDRDNRMIVRDSFNADQWKIEEQNRENRQRAKYFENLSYELDRWQIEEQDEQNQLSAAEYEQSVKALQKYIDHTKTMDQCISSAE